MKERERRVVFNPLDRQADIDIANRNLPHWFQIDATLFVTFRTHDSIPRKVHLRWQQELEQWLSIRRLPTELASSTVNRKNSDHEQIVERLSSGEQAEFRKMSDRIFHRSLDECHGSCPFKNPALARIVGDAIRHRNGDVYDLNSFIVMPNHVHALVQFREAGGLEIVSQSWMRYTARRINNLLGQSGPLWQPEPFDHILRSVVQFYYLRDYIADNPQNAHLRPEDYLYWRM